jgi:hypothetical protein
MWSTVSVCVTVILNIYVTAIATSKYWTTSGFVSLVISFLIAMFCGGTVCECLNVKRKLGKLTSFFHSSPCDSNYVQNECQSVRAAVATVAEFSSGATIVSVPP